MIRQRLFRPVVTVAHEQALGVRETWHAHALHRLSGSEPLNGDAFPDTVAVGTYPVDIHSTEGTILRFLDGDEVLVTRDGATVNRRWRPEQESDPGYFQVPFRSLVPAGASNLLVASRILDADRDAFGAVRVMVNMNQTGEAAAIALQLVCPFQNVPFDVLRANLCDGGSLLPEISKG